MARNKPWTRDELILALDLYFTLRPAQYDSTEPKVIELSELLAGIPAQDGEYRDANYRSPAGIAMKLANILYIDPSRPGGLKAVGRLDREVWEEFNGDRDRLHAVASSIRQALQSQESPPPSYDDEEAAEGRILTRLHKARERKPALVKKKKAKVLEQQGKLACEACGFDFEATYGAHGTGFIECHHTQPLHTLEPGSRTKLKDLVLLCANCHRMVHAKRPWLTMDELRALIH